MKKVLIAILLYSAVTLSGCTKEYTCQCREVYTNGSIKRTWTPIKESFSNQSDASAWCSNNEVSGFGVSIECDLK